MAYSKHIADFIRRSLAHLTQVEEKKMFGGLAFMVNGKMCLTAGPDRMMCRIDPALHETMIQKEGCTPVTMRGRIYKGYVHLTAEAIASPTNMTYWINLALDYNQAITVA